VRVTWDPSKAASNLVKHGVAFDRAEGFEWQTALVQSDIRFDYPEPRLSALGAIGDRLYFLVYTIEHRSTRIISLREANRREVKRYASES
jgi:uncharacterized DUF497 family protein